MNAFWVDTHTKDRLSSTTTRHRLLSADSWKLTEWRSIRLLGWVDLAGELGVLKSYQIRPVQFENVPPKSQRLSASSPVSHAVWRVSYVFAFVCMQMHLCRSVCSHSVYVHVES